MTAVARCVIAGTHSGVGKTSVATGLMAALSRRGTRVAPFKVGPDFIDPGYHALAAGTAGRNLDAVLSGAALLGPLLRHGTPDGGLAVIEGVMGLFDGASRPLEGAAPPGPPLRGDPGSTAHVARLLDAPVLLVVDAGAIAGSIAALVHGYATFDPALRVAGVIANRVAGGRHAELLAEALDPLGVPLLGALPIDDADRLPERHLGLVPAAEHARAARAAVAALADISAAHVDLEAVERLARSAPPVHAPAWAPTVQGGPPVRIAVARGPAFTFVYPENLEALAAAGAELVPFDPTSEEALPDACAGLYLGGGFPETHGDVLAANAPARAAVAGLARRGVPVLAECGGLLYLCERLDGHPMCGVIPASGRLTDRLAIGYRAAEAAAASPLWERGARVRGHVFHASRLDPAAGEPPAWHLDGQPDGFVHGSVHASYLHTHWAATPEVAQRFTAAARAAGGAGRRGPP